jgi:mannose-6-phosphate isomerase
MSALLPPLPLCPNRQRRTYRGGLLLERFLGDPTPADGDRPEEWVGSDTRAAAADPASSDGISRCRLPDGTTPLLSELIARDAETLLGRDHLRRHGPHLGMLVKLLDAACRLAIQVHPDRAFARRHLDSDFGKTEAWLVLATRVIDGIAPHVLFGFRRGVTAEAFAAAYRTQDVAAMAGMLNRVPVTAGDTFLIPGGMPHAIGSGVFMVEPQEPTDFTFRFEHQGPCWNLRPEQIHLGLGDDRMLAALDFAGPRGAEALAACRRRLDGGDGVCDPLPVTSRSFFTCRQVRVVAGAIFDRPDGRAVIGICTAGDGLVRHPAGDLPIAGGRTFLIPATGSPAYRAGAAGLTIFETLPPAQEQP